MILGFNMFILFKISTIHTWFRLGLVRHTGMYDFILFYERGRVFPALEQNSK
jgi:hypothetical protein